MHSISNVKFLHRISNVKLRGVLFWWCLSKDSAIKLEARVNSVPKKLEVRWGEGIWPPLPCHRSPVTTPPCRQQNYFLTKLTVSRRKHCMYISNFVATSGLLHPFHLWFYFVHWRLQIVGWIQENAFLI